MRDWLLLPCLHPGISKRPAMLPMEAITASVAAHFGVKIKLMLSKWRNPEFSAPRHVVMWLATLDGRRSLPQIGRYFRRHHTTIMYARDRVQRGVEAHSELGETAVTIARRLGLSPDLAGGVYAQDDTYSLCKKTLWTGTSNRLRGRQSGQYLEDAPAMEGSV